MTKLDEIKEHIGVLKAYLGVVAAVVLSVGAGVAKLYGDGGIGLLFWLGIGLIVVALAVFTVIVRAIHRNINKFGEL